MALAHSPKIVTNGLRAAVDVANLRCYSGTGNDMKNIAGNENPAGTTLVTVDNAIAGKVMNHDASSAYTINFDPHINHETWSLVWLARSTGTTPSNYRVIIRLVESTYNTYFYNIDTRETTNTYVLGYQKDEAVSSWLSHNYGTNQTMWTTGDWIWFGATHNNKVFKAYRNGVLQSTQTQNLNVDTYGDIKQLSINFNSGNTVDTGPIYCYDRVLDDNEMKQNFEAIRGRFGL